MLYVSAGTHVAPPASIEWVKRRKICVPDHIEFPALTYPHAVRPFPIPVTVEEDAATYGTLILFAQSRIKGSYIGHVLGLKVDNPSVTMGEGAKAIYAIRDLAAGTRIPYWGTFSLRKPVGSDRTV